MKNLKHFLLAMLLCISFLYTQAQTYVTIPDANFRAALQSQISGCFNASGQLDINCSSISNLTYLYLDNQNIQDLTGIEYLTSLTTVYCAGNGLTFLPTLPDTITYLDCRNNQIASMVNVPSVLQYLYLTDNQLTTLPALSGSLYVLEASNNNLTTLPTLPSSLNQFDCSNNNLTTIPNLPANLDYLNCSHNPISTLPTLVNSLYSLNVAYTSLTNLSVSSLSQLNTLDISGNPNLVTSSFPSSLVRFYCEHNNLTSLPTLPSNLTTLHCGYNNFTTINLTTYTSLYDVDISGNPLSTLPTFFNFIQILGIADLNLSSLPPIPNSVYNLNCSHNNLTSLSGINNVSYLNCSYNQLTSLPSSNYYELDCSHNIIANLIGIQYMFILNCSYNQITYIPFLNTVSYANVSNNPLGCLPTLSDSLLSLDISNTFISCIPNNPNTLPNLASQLGLPLCSGTNGVCQPANISGKAYFDMNNNAVLDAGEGPLPYFYVIATHPQMGTYAGISDANGNYSIDVSPATGNYDVSFGGYSYLPSYYTVNPTTPYSVSLPTPGSTSANNDFYAYAPPVNDLSVQLYAQTARPGFDRDFYIYPFNYGTSAQNATVTLTFDANYSFVSSNIAPSSQNGNVLTFNISNLAPYYMGYSYYSYAIVITLHLDIATPLGIAVNHSCSIDPIAGDVTPLNNTDALTQITTNAVDPNLKHVNHKVLSPQQVLDATPLAYHIEFQNTGTDTAYTVVIRDTLSENVEVGSLEMVGASNPFTLSIEDNHILVWTFLNIMLVDSNTNEPASHGFIDYRIKPKTTLQIGDEIHNTAHIYFDYNDAVVTNTAITKVQLPQNVAIATDVKVVVSPNPVKDALQITVNGLSSKWLEMNVLDAQGKVILSEKASNFSGEWAKKVEVSSWAKGIYLLQIRTEKGISMEKISVE